MKNYIGSLEPNKQITLIYERDGQSKSVSFTLKADSAALSDAGLIEGLELKELTANSKNASSGISGVYVSGVKKGSKAENIGFKEGDIIIAVEQNEVKNLAELSAALKQNQSKSFTKIWIFRDGGAQLLVLR